MKIAILLFPRFTALDAVGPYEVLSRLPNADLVFIGEKLGPVRTDTNRLAIEADATLEDIPAADIVLIPGGPGQSALMEDGPVHEWIRTIDAKSTWTTTVCTGSLILAATGLLKDKKATTHWLPLNQLQKYGAIPTPRKSGHRRQIRNRSRSLRRNRHDPDPNRKNSGRNPRAHSKQTQTQSNRPKRKPPQKAPRRTAPWGVWGARPPKTKRSGPGKVQSTDHGPPIRVAGTGFEPATSGL